jgi:hypothetical protein
MVVLLNVSVVCALEECGWIKNHLQRIGETTLLHINLHTTPLHTTPHHSTPLHTTPMIKKESHLTTHVTYNARTQSGDGGGVGGLHRSTVHVGV